MRVRSNDLGKSARRRVAFRSGAVAGLALGLLVLTACSRSEPAVAAYIGDERITETRITELADSFNETAPPESQVSREQVVEIAVVDAVCRMLRDELGFTVPATELPPEATALQRLDTEANACMTAVPSEPVEPTESDLREVFDRGIELGAIPAGTTFEQAAPQLAGGGELAAALGRRQAIQAVMDSEDISVNPRYRGLELALLSFQAGPAVAVPLGQPVSDAVTDSATQ